MQFGIEKCNTIAMKKGEHYKYLGVEELLSTKEDFKQNIKRSL